MLIAARSSSGSSQRRTSIGRSRMYSSGRLCVFVRALDDRRRRRCRRPNKLDSVNARARNYNARARVPQQPQNTTTKARVIAAF